MNRVATIGTFDGVHCGHRIVIEKVKQVAEQKGYIPTVFAFVEHPLQVVAPERVPAKLMSFENQIAAFEKLCVDVVPIHFNEQMRKMSARLYMEQIRDDYGVRVLVVGYDNRFGCNRNETFEDYDRYGRELGIDIVAAPEMSEVSSTIIRNLLEQGDVELANKKLGYLYAIDGIVEHGKHLGATIGFPTANMRLSDCRRLVPANGVYAAIATTADGLRHGAMVNIGHCPTIDCECHPRTIEIHILNFSEDIYGEHLNLEFVKFMRKERKMCGLDELRSQLIIDRTETRRYLNEINLEC